MQNETLFFVPPEQHHFSETFTAIHSRPQAKNYLDITFKDCKGQETLLNVLDKIQRKNEQKERLQIKNSDIVQNGKIPSKPLPQEEVEDILDGLFSKLMHKKNLFDDEKVCSKVEKLMSNPLFQRIADKLDGQNSQSIPSWTEPDTPNTEPIILPDMVSEDEDEYEDDDDPGFLLYETEKENLAETSKALGKMHNFPVRACDEGLIDLMESRASIAQEEEKIEEERPQKRLLPIGANYPVSNDEFYPVRFGDVRYNCFDIKYIFDQDRTGFEETKDFPIVINSVIAGRYQVLNFLGSAAFSHAIECLDLITQQKLCMKIIKNEKDYLDQSMDEIKLLKLINHNANVDEKHVIKFYDCFYHKEHLFIITELLQENLYEFSKLNQEGNQTPYFTLERLKTISKQVLTALDYIHGLNLIHCDLKPENILMKDPDNVEVKVIDFGSSCFTHDYLSSYVQSRPYRAPEVILGCKYDTKVDLWSLGCVLAELWTGNVLFQSETVAGLLARVIGILGPMPEKMFREGKLCRNFFTTEKILQQEVLEEGQERSVANHFDSDYSVMRNEMVQLLVPKRSSLRKRLKTDDLLFLDFVRNLLQVDPSRRPTAREAMRHPWLVQ